MKIDEVMEKRFKFEKLNVYLKAIEFADMVYCITEKFPKSEQYGMVNQIRRCTTSIALNIAEGYGRFHSKIKKQFYNFARSSVYECIPILTISLHQKYINRNEYEKLYSRCFDLSRMISRLIIAVDNRKINEK